jgi:hypothetical protein
MTITATEIFMFFGFLVAGYSIVANDAIQTLGTFLSSNSHRPWWLLWLYACSILVAVLVYGWIVNFGDVAYGRLEKFPEPPGGISWLHAIPPVFILLLTRFGVPVSTTFLVLTVFAPSNLEQMLVKSMLGYGVAIVVGILVYSFVSRIVEKRFIDTRKTPPKVHWVALQWLSTAFLWSQWLIQDLANIFVYLPRQLGVELLLFAIIVMLLLHAYIFYRRGGRIQGIVTSKTNTTDIRSATIIDFMFGCILWYFKQISNIPMSTTWVFLGLLAGRELALTLQLRMRPMRETTMLILQDAGKAMAGLLVSLGLAFGLPAISNSMNDEDSVAAVTTPDADSDDREPGSGPDSGDAADAQMRRSD